MAVAQYLGKVMALSQGEPPPQQAPVDANLTASSNRITYSEAGQSPPGATSAVARSWLTPASWMQLAGLFVGLVAIIFMGSLLLSWKRADRYER